MRYRILRVDNFDREIYPEVFVTNIPESSDQGKIQAVADALNALGGATTEHYFRVVPSDHKPFEGFQP